MNALEAFEPGTAVTVATAASTLVAAANPARLEITVCNDGANTVYLRLSDDDAAAVSEGIRLNASGGNWSSSVYKGAVYGRASTADVVCTVAEV